MKSLKTSSSLKALFNKEMKRYLSSYIYIMNTSLGVIVLTLGVIAMVIFGSDQLDQLLGIPNFEEILRIATPLLMAFLCLINSTTQASISLENKSLGILKSLPIKTREILLSKILVNLVVVMPFIFINATILAFYLKLSFLTYVLCLIIPLLSTIFIASFGLIINLAFPVLEWDNEVRAIKQSMASLITVLSGMALAMAPIGLLIYFEFKYLNIFIWGIMGSLIILDILLIWHLNIWGVKKFERLQ